MADGESSEGATKSLSKTLTDNLNRFLTPLPDERKNKPHVATRIGAIRKEMTPNVSERISLQDQLAMNRERQKIADATRPSGRSLRNTTPSPKK